MRFVVFTHSLVSDWNHGNAHFLRGITTELVERGHEVRIFEPDDSWSRQNLLDLHGSGPIVEFEAAYPRIRSSIYNLATLNLDDVLSGSDVVLVHEWNSPDLVARVGKHRAKNGKYALFFHDTHHRSVTAPAAMASYDLRHYDCVLAYGNVIRDIYVRNHLVQRARTWHEAGDIRVFHPVTGIPKEVDLVWIGNWDEEDRAAELREFLIEPVKRLGVTAWVYGVRYPASAISELADAGIEYRGWLPNYRVPEIFGRARVTVHIPRRPYARALPGIPTIRPFEAMACGIPLVSAPWDDCERLFRPGCDFLVAKDGSEMAAHVRSVLHDRDLAQSLIAHGLETIHDRHTCSHRVEELLAITAEMKRPAAVAGGF